MTANEIFDSISAKGHLLIARNLNNEIYPPMDWGAIEKWLEEQYAKDPDEDGDFLARKYIKEMNLDKDLVDGIANLAYAVREYLLADSMMGSYGQ
jgi:hypothetical protein